jgi:biopolymer transport protein ExbD
MKLRHTPKQDPEITLTPLIDVVFLLVIFFMVTTTFTRESELAVELPEAQGNTLPEIEEVVEISIDLQGNYYVNQQQLVNTQPETLKRALEQTIGEESSPPPLRVSADARTPHQAVVTAMDVAGQAGFVHLSIVARQPEDEP